MYIEKTINTYLGIPATYHTLHAMHVYYNNGVTHIDVAGYISKDAKENGGQAIVINQIEIQQVDFENEEAIYNAILASQAFSDGVLYNENEKLTIEELVNETQ